MNIPCKQCIGLAMCISKREVICDILWSYYKKEEYKLMAMKVMMKILPNMEGIIHKYSNNDIKRIKQKGSKQ